MGKEKHIATWNPEKYWEIHSRFKKKLSITSFLLSYMDPIREEAAAETKEAKRFSQGGWNGESPRGNLAGHLTPRWSTPKSCSSERRSCWSTFLKVKVPFRMDLIDVVQWINHFYGTWINKSEWIYKMIKMMDVGFYGFLCISVEFWWMFNFEPLLATK